MTQEWPERDDLVLELDLFNQTYEFPWLYSGFLNVDPLEDINLFYTFVREETLDSSTPLVLWLNGGPGSSSQLGLFLENGPLRLVENQAGETELHSLTGTSWTSVANMLYLDQPVGAGYSYGNKLYTSQEEVRNYTLNFLQMFYQIHPDMEGRDFYITGESYAGKYIPNIAHEILEFNKRDNVDEIPLKGVAIGNGFMEPKEQRLLPHKLGLAAGLIPLDSYPEIDILNKRWEEGSHNASEAYDLWFETAEFIKEMGGNMDNYDIRWPGDNMTHDQDQILEYLNRPLVVSQLHADMSPRDPKFDTWNKTVFHHFNAYDGLKSYSHLYDTLLEFKQENGGDHLPMIVYYGNMDLKFGAYQQHRLLENMGWIHKKEFLGSAQNIYYYINEDDSIIGGNYKQYKNFNFLTVYSAGHLVPTTQLALSKNMLQDLIKYKGLHCHQEDGDCTVKQEMCEFMNDCNDRGDCVNGQCIDCVEGHYGPDCSIKAEAVIPGTDIFESGRLWSYYKIHASHQFEYFAKSEEPIVVYKRDGDIPTKSIYQAKETGTEIIIKNKGCLNKDNWNGTIVDTFIGIYNPSMKVVNFKLKGKILVNLMV